MTDQFIKNPFKIYKQQIVFQNKDILISESSTKQEQEEKLKILQEDYPTVKFSKKSIYI